MKIIVTGGAGFVGSHLTELLIKNGHFPIIIDNLNTGKFKYIKKFVDEGKADFIKLDIRNFSKLMKLPKCSAVIHLAAIASVLESIDNPFFVNDVNVNGTLNMLEFCRKKNIKKFIFTSSAAIFGNNESKITESSPTVPTTVYGSSKLTGEQYCRIYSELFGITTIILRPFNIYGPRQNDTYAGVITKFLNRLKKNKPPIIFGTGKQTRDFIHAHDVARAFFLALRYNKTKFDVFNLGTGKSTSINTLARYFLNSTKKHSTRLIHRKAIPGIIIYNSMNNTKLKKGLGLIPSVSLKEGISDLIINNS
jgi:UDP-glucose 4-epimerase